MQDDEVFITGHRPTIDNIRFSLTAAQGSQRFSNLQNRLWQDIAISLENKVKHKQVYFLLYLSLIELKAHPIFHSFSVDTAAPCDKL